MSKENKNPGDHEELAKKAVKVLLSDKGIDVKLFRVSETTVITDYYIIATGRSTTHIRALADDIIDKLEKTGVIPSHVEGRDGGSWILIDYDFFIVHVFSDESRRFYNLERLLPDRDGIDISDIEKELDDELSSGEIKA